jgi:hypothetical protein
MFRICQSIIYDYRNYVSPNELGVYALDSVSRRRGGPLEDRLRRAVALYVSRRGAAQELAAQIGRPPSWITEYKQGTNHANLDTSIALMRAIGWRPEDVLSSGPIDEEALTLLARIRELGEEERALAMEFVERVSGGAVVFVGPRSPARRMPAHLQAGRRAGGKQRGA